MAPIIEVSDETLRTLNPTVYTLRNDLISRKNESGPIYVPSINANVSGERTHQRENWYVAHEALAKDKLEMLTPKEYVEFLKYSRENHPEVYEDIVSVRDPWRAEWIDAFFEKKKDGLYILTHNKSNAEKLSQDTLMEDRKISLESWLENPTSQGLPRKDAEEGSLYYWHPRSDTVAGLGAGSVRAGFDCGGDPLGRGPDLGVRVSKKRE